MTVFGLTDLFLDARAAAAAALFLLLMAAATPPPPDLMFSKEMAVRRLCLPPDRTAARMRCLSK